MLDAIAFVTGATLSAMLGLMQWRVDRAAGRVSGYLLLWVVGFLWTFGNFLRCALDLAGAPPDATGTKSAENLAWACTLLGPIAIGKLVQGGIGAATRASRGFFAFTVGIAALNLGLMIRGNQLHDWHVEASSYPTWSFCIAVVVGAMALLVYFTGRPSPAATAMPRWFMPAAFSFAFIHTAAILLTMLFPEMPEGLMAAANLIGRHWTIPWSVLIAVSLAQAHYTDVILKRSIWLLASVTLATLATTWMSDSTPGLRELVTTLAIAALMLAASTIARTIDSLVDEAILDRPDYDAAAAALTEHFRLAARPEQLVDAALASLRKTLRVDARWLDAGEHSVAAPLAAVVISREDQPAHRLEIMASHHARTLMQRELGFFATVARQLEHRLEAMQFEQEQRALHLREERLKRLLTEAELKALRTQVDPHFLFNTLNTIADLIRTNPDQAERMTERLAECFRYALAKHARDLSTLDEELGFARQYLEIEQVRFGQRLRVQLSRGDAHGDEPIPSLLLQPLLENAIRHGLAPVREGGCVSVQARREGERLHLRIEDDGVGLRDGFAAHSGVGLRNVQERLRTLYAQTAEFLIGARPGGRGTAVTIVIPLHVH
jgi:two-component system, LytTR family, sensor kinase